MDVRSILHGLWSRSGKSARRADYGLVPILPISGALLALLALAVACHVPARADGTFTITLAGTQQLSKTTTAADGTTARRVAYALKTSDGYPRLAIAVTQGRETLYPDGQTKTVTGPNGGRIQVAGVIQATGSAIDPIGGTKLFDVQLRGAILPNHSELLRFSSPESDTTSQLTITVSYPSSEDSSVSGQANGTLTLDPSADPAVVGNVWGTSAAPDQGSADPTLWYLTRGAAATAYVLLAAVVALGIALGFQGFAGLVRAWRILDLHQLLTLVMLGFVALHLATLVLDPFKPFTLLQIAWPLGEAYRPLWTALGVLAVYLLLVITASSYLRRALGNRAWFALHLLSFPVFVLLTLHGIFTGTDTTTPWMLGIYTAASALVLLLTLARIYFALVGRRAGREPAAAQALDPASARR